MDSDEHDLEWDFYDAPISTDGGPRLVARTGPPPLPEAARAIPLGVAPEGAFSPAFDDDNDTDGAVVVDERELIDILPGGRERTAGTRADSLVPVACGVEDDEDAEVVPLGTGAARSWSWGLGLMAGAAAAMVAMTAGRPPVAGAVWWKTGANHSAIARLAKAPVPEKLVTVSAVVIVVDPDDLAPRQPSEDDTSRSLRQLQELVALAEAKQED